MFTPTPLSTNERHLSCLSNQDNLQEIENPSQEKQKTRDFEDCPVEIIKEVFSFITEANVRLSISLTSKRWKEIGEEVFNPSVNENQQIKLASKLGKCERVIFLLKDPRVDPSADYNYAVRIASKYGHSKVVKALLKDERVDPSANRNFAIRMACRKGHLEVVQELLKDNQVNATKSYVLDISTGQTLINAFEEAWDQGQALVVKELLSHRQINSAIHHIASAAIVNFDENIEIFKDLLKDSRIDPCAYDNRVIHIEYARGRLEAVKELMKDERVKSSFNMEHPPFVYTIERGFSEAFEEELEDKEISSDDNPNRALQEASKKGDVDSVKACLLHSQVDPTANEDYAIRYASAYGHQEIVKELLKDGKADPSAKHNFAIRWASFYGHTKVVKRLLQDNRVDPTDYEHFAILYACQNGHTKVVKALLKDERVDPSATDNFALYIASENGYLEIVQLLLQDNRVTSAGLPKHALMRASFRGHFEIVKELLHDERNHSPPIISHAIEAACNSGQITVLKELVQYNYTSLSDDLLTILIKREEDEMLKILLTITNLDPSLNDHAALLFASSWGHVDCIKELLKDKRVIKAGVDNQGRTFWKAIYNASRNGHIEAAKELLKNIEKNSENNIYALKAVTHAKNNGHTEIVQLLHPYLKNSILPPDVKAL